MYVLGIDTSTTMCGAAVCHDGRRVEGYETLVVKSHSQTLLPLVRSLLEACRLTPRDLDAFAVSSGPGSFTGLRIGISMTKGLALPNERPALGVPTLDAVASCAPLAESRVCALLDARRGEVYAAFYARRSGRLTRLTADQVISPEQLCEAVNEPTFFLGEGVERHGNVLNRRLGSDLFRRGNACRLPVASKVAEIGTALLLRWIPGGRVEVVPNYVRRSDAEINWEKRFKGTCGP